MHVCTCIYTLYTYTWTSNTVIYIGFCLINLLSVLHKLIFCSNMHSMIKCSAARVDIMPPSQWPTQFPAHQHVFPHWISMSLNKTLHLMPLMFPISRTGKVHKLPKPPRTKRAWGLRVNLLKRRLSVQGQNRLCFMWCVQSLAFEISSKKAGIKDNKSFGVWTLLNICET